jgi:hypothetical protein
VKVVGDAHVLLALAKDIGLQDALIAAFGSEDALTLLSLALYQSGGARALYLAKAWLEERELPAAMKLEAVGTDRVYAALEEKMRQAGLLRKMTVAEVLAQLRKIKAVRTRTERRFLLEISKHHRELLADLGIPLPTRM